jgi:membrane fusion protein, multidrug efflux system
MPADGVTVSLRTDTAEAPAARRAVSQEEWELSAERSSAPEKAPRPLGRRWLRWTLFLLLPIALIVGAYFYFEGGAYMSTDDAYIKADKVGLSTDVSGMVEAIEVSDNQHVTAGQVLFRLDPLPFQLKLDQAQSQLGVVRDNLNALKGQLPKRAGPDKACRRPNCL